MSNANREAAFRSWWDQRLKEEKAEKMEKTRDRENTERNTVSDTDQAAAKAYVDFRFRQCLQPASSGSLVPEHGESLLNPEVLTRTDAVLKAELNLLQIQIEHSEDQVQELRMDCEAAKIGADRFKELNAVLDMKVKDSQALDSKITETLHRDESLTNMLSELELAQRALSFGQSNSPGGKGSRSDPHQSGRLAAGGDGAQYDFLGAFTDNSDMDDFEAQVQIEKQQALNTLNLHGGSGRGDSPTRKKSGVVALKKEADAAAARINNLSGASPSRQNQILELRVKLQKALSDAEMNSPMVNYPELLTVTSELSQVKHRMAFDRRWCEAAMSELVDLQNTMDSCVKARDKRDEEHAQAVMHLDTAQRDAFGRRKEITMAHKKLAFRSGQGDHSSIETTRKITQELEYGSMETLDKYIEDHIRGQREEDYTAPRIVSRAEPDEARQPQLFRREAINMDGYGGVGSSGTPGTSSRGLHADPTSIGPNEGAHNAFLTTPAAAQRRGPQASSDGLNVTPTVGTGMPPVENSFGSGTVSWNQKKW